MSKAVRLMENTVTNTFSLFNERVFKRNRRFFREVSPSELTSEMCHDAGVATPEYVLAKEAPKGAAPAASVPTSPTPVRSVVDGGLSLTDVAPPAPSARPDYTGWTEDRFREYTQEHDIPIHPQAKIPGMRSAIDRYFDDLARINQG